MRSSLAPSSLGFEGAPPATLAAGPAREAAAVAVSKEAKGATHEEAAKTPIEELEPLDSPPPSYIILCCEWMAMKMCGYSPLDKEETSPETGKKKLKS